MPKPSKSLPKGDVDPVAALRAELGEVKKLALELAAKPSSPSALEAEIALLRKENAALSAQLQRQDPGAASSDLAYALKHSIDDLQRACAVMDNPVSDFAVKEFALQANVVMSIDLFGQPRYRFLRPGEQVDERAVSRLNIALVPLPKQTLQGQILAQGGGDIDIEMIDGIGDAYRKMLNQRGIYSIADLLKTGTRVRSRAELAALLGVERNKLSSWISQAELMTLKDVGEFGEKALRRAGVLGLSDLSRRDSTELLELIRSKLDAQTAKKLGALEEARVKGWIDAARSFLGEAEPPLRVERK